MRSVIALATLVALAALAALSALTAGATAARGDVIRVNPASLTPTSTVTFDKAGTPFGGVEPDIYAPPNEPGIAFGERFAGQALTASGDFDVLGTAASGPLTLLAGLPTNNLAVLAGPDSADLSAAPGFTLASRALAGIGPGGVLRAQDLGEGSIAGRFAAPTGSFGLTLLGTDGGVATFDFFAGDGSSLGRLAVANLIDGPVAFAERSGVADIAGFSVFTDDPGGLAVDDVVLTQAAVVPEPSALMLLAAGVGCLVLGVRLRNVASSLTADC